jgi:hypothetical protein
LALLPWLLVALVAIAASVTSLGNGFAYDDVHAIVRNERVHSLAAPWTFFTQPYWPPGTFHGGSTLYRPLTTLGFAVQWTLGGGGPLVFHCVSLLLYVAVCLAVYGLMRPLLPAVPAILAAALFAAHPVHVEAVANCVGQGELWVALFVVLAVSRYVSDRRQGTLTPRSRGAIYAWYILACLAKDNGLILPGLLLAAEFTVVQDQREARVRLRTDSSFWFTLILIGVLYLAVRTTVTGTLAGDIPHVAIANATYLQQVLTTLRISLEWLRLLVWPAHLQADYSPRDLVLARTFGLGQLLGLLLLSGVVAAAVWTRRRRPVVAHGLIWVAIAIFPVSNLVLKAGILLAERTLFLPSVGAMLVIGGGLQALVEWRPASLRPVLVAGAALVLLGAWRSAVRQPVWKDNETLFAQTVVDAPRNYRAHWLYGLNLFEHGQREAAFKSLSTAIELYPNDASLYSDAGDLYRTDGHCEQSIPLYHQALMLNSQLPYTQSRLASCYMRLGDYGSARLELEKLVAAGYLEFAPLIQAVDSAAVAAGAFQ